MATYANSLRNGFALDDHPVIAANEAAHDPTDWRRIFLTSSWFSGASPSIAYRPLTTFTFAVDHALHGARPLGYHAVNVVGHAIVSALVVLLAAALGSAPVVAGMAGAFFATHPIHTEAVANGVGRAEILAAIFVLTALLARVHVARGAGGSGASLLAVAATGFGLFAKEHAVALVVLLPLVDLLVADGGSLARFRDRLRGRIAFYGAVVSVTAAYLALRTVALGGLVGAGGEGTGGIPFWQNPVAAGPAGVRVLTALAVLARAVGLLIAPITLSADYSYAHLVPIESVTAPAALAGVATVGFLVALAVTLRRHAAALLWLALALASWAIVSNLIVPIGTIFGERLLYLPSAGFCALIAMALGRARGPAAQRLALGAAVALAVVWGVRSWVRNPAWGDNVRLAEATVATAPRSAQAHYLLGTTYAGLGRTDEAVRALERALAIDPGHLDARFNLGVIHMQAGRTVEATRRLREVVEREPRHFASWVNLAALANGAGDFEAGLECAEHAIAIRGDAPNGHVMRGYALRGLGRLAEAATAFQRALRLPGAQADALLGFGTTVLALGDFRRATAAFEHLVRVAPSADAWAGLVASYRGAGRVAAAERALATARADFPGLR